MDRVADVFYGERFAGILIEDQDGYAFTYDVDYLAGGVPLSFNLPLRLEPFRSSELLPFFENLVAEGWMQRTQSIIQRIDESDRFGLLLANGRDLVGAVTVIPVAASGRGQTGR